MKLRTKIVCLILVAFMGYLGASFMVQRLVILPSFVSLEQERAVTNVERCKDALTREIEHLKVQCQDWSSWDDSYEFVEDGNEDFIAETLMVESYENAELNLIYFISPSGELVWGKVYDLSGEEAGEIEPVLDDLAEHPSLLSHKDTSSFVSGIVSTRHGPMLIASLPILTSDNEGPIRGSLMMGRLLTGDKISQIAKQTKVDLNIWEVDDPAIPAENRAVMDTTTTQSIQLVEHDHQIDGYAIYQDVNGVPILLMLSHIPTQIIARGEAAMHSATLTICMAGLVTMLLLLIAMQRIVINPLHSLTRHAVQVGKTSNLTTRIEMNRADEIGELADTLDRMVDQLSQSRTALAEASRSAGKADVASRVLHNVGNVLNSVNVSAETTLAGLSKLPVDDLSKIATMLKDNADHPGRYLADDPKGRLIPGFLTELSSQMTDDRGLLTRELHTLTGQIDHIKSVVAMQQEDSKFSKVEEIGSLQEAVNHALKINDELIGGLGINLTRSFQDLAPVWFDRHMLMDIVINLVRNAVHAVEGNPAESRDIEIVIRSSDDGEQALVIVQDNGTGIEPGHMTQIFNHGFTTRDRGHGFGLHSAALAAKELEGSLVAHSGGTGQGATFTLTIPMKTAEVLAA